MTYQWKSGARIRADAQVAGAVMERLEQTCGLTAKTLLDASRPPSAPLHDVFEWDDAKAAEAYRLDQSGHLIRCITVTPENQDAEPVRAYFICSEDEAKYKNITAILTDPDSRTQLFKTAMNELLVFKNKYQQLEQFDRIVQDIDQLTEESQ